MVYLHKLLNQCLLRLPGRALTYNGDGAGIRIDYKRSFCPSSLARWGDKGCGLWVKAVLFSAV